MLAQEPENNNTLYSKAVALHNLGRNEEAITFFDMVLEIDPNNADALNGKGYSLYKLDRNEVANEQLDEHWK